MHCDPTGFWRHGPLLLCHTEGIGERWGEWHTHVRVVPLGRSLTLSESTLHVRVLLIRSPLDVFVVPTSCPVPVPPPWKALLLPARPVLAFHPESHHPAATPRHRCAHRGGNAALGA